MKDPAKLAATVRALREARGMTQDELATKSGLHLKQIQRVEGGRVKKGLRTDTLHSLARALSVKPERITGTPPPKYDVRPLLAEIEKDPDLMLILGTGPTPDEKAWLHEVEYAQFDGRVPLTPRRVALALVGLRGEPRFLEELKAWKAEKGES